jgi:hypothetical protein
MGSDGRIGELLDMVAATAGNFTLAVVDEIHLWNA